MTNSRKLKILVDINHPAHVHFFKNFIWEMRKLGHEVIISATSKDITFKLLKSYDFKWYNLGKYGKTYLSKIFFFFIINIRMLFLLFREKPDCVMSISSARPIFPRLLGIRLYVFTDTEHAKFQIRLFEPFATKIITPDCFTKDFGRKHVRYSGYHELAYLHPNRFMADKRILEEAEIKEGEKFFILRFVAWNATHDIGEHGLTQEEKRKLISLLSSYGKIMITSESKVPEDMKKYLMKIGVAKIHDLLSFSELCIGEGATMASEAAVLGVPAIFTNTLHMGYTDEEREKYGLLFQYEKFEDAEKKIIELLAKPNLKKEWQEKRAKLLKDKIDVTEWMIQFIHNEYGIELSSAK